MTAPDPKWVEAGARALHARYCTCGSPDRIERRNAGIAVAAVEPLIRADERARAYPGREVRSQLVRAYAQLSHAEAVAARLVEVIRVDDLRLRTQKGHTAQARRERDAARAEVEEIRATLRAESRLCAEARAEVAALQVLAQDANEAFAAGRREVLADLRAKVEGLEHGQEECWSVYGGGAACDCTRGAVLALIEEAGRD